MISRYGASVVFLSKKVFAIKDSVNNYSVQRLDLLFQMVQKSLKDILWNQKREKCRMFLHGRDLAGHSLKPGLKKWKEEVKADLSCVTIKSKIFSYVSK